MARATNQPTYDFLSGGEVATIQPSREPLRETLRQSSINTRDTVNNEELRTQLRRLQYELDAVKQERDLEVIHHQDELRAVRETAEAEVKQAQSQQTGDAIAAKKIAALQRDYQELQNRTANEKLSLEKKVRDLQSDSRSLREELEDVQADRVESARKQDHAYHELEQRYATLDASVDETRSQLQEKVNVLQHTQERLNSREQQYGELENEILRLKAQSGDVDTLSLIKKELSDQVEYIRELESTNRAQLAQIKQFKKTVKAVEIVEEEKRTLETKLRAADSLRQELAEAQLQRRMLEDEKKGWTSYLETEAASQDMQYNTPEDMARAFMQERLQSLDLVDRLGRIQPELAVKDENIKSLEEELSKIRVEMSESRSAPATAPDAKARHRLERQKNLAVKEIEYLRAQVKSMEAEEAEFTSEQIDSTAQERMHELEMVVEQYRAEVQTLHEELSKLELQTPQSPRKREREEDDEETSQRIGDLRRRAQTLEAELTQAQNRNRLLDAELKASTSQINTLKESRTRVLELRNNPTAELQAIKINTLNTLREENASLLAQLQGKSAPKVVPVSSLENVQLQLDELKKQLAQTEKKSMRLKQIFSDKSLEFREAVASILGWKLDFMPNGRVKATSILYPTSLVDGEDEENSIVFDGENGTMKVSGGPQSPFAKEIRSLIEFWVESRKEIPCFLAACTLEFYDRTTRAQKL